MAGINSKHCSVKDIEISTPWNFECNDKDLNCSLSIDTLNKSVDLEDIVQLDTCIHLIKNEETTGENKEPCTITISTSEQSTDLISRIVLVSEARILEFYGNSGEYITTFVADYVDDFEDCSVYMAECNIRPSKHLTIKFQKTKHADSLWLYGINLRLSQRKGLLTNLSSINLQSVNDILKETKIPISENAEKCKTFLQAYYTGTTKAPDSQMLMKMIETGYFNSFGETMSKCISNIVPFLSRDLSDTTLSDVAGSTHDKKFYTDSNDILGLKSYIDKRFSALESRIVKFEEKVREVELKQTEKLDQIIAILNRQFS